MLLAVLAIGCQGEPDRWDRKVRQGLDASGRKVLADTRKAESMGIALTPEQERLKASLVKQEELARELREMDEKEKGR